MKQPPETPNEHYFSADKPIPNREADRLGRAGFAEAIATSIENWTDKESLVIAIYGPWGMGKTSIKNMIVDSINASKRQKAAVVEFNPWEVANRDQLTEQFFDELALTLGKGTIASGENRRRLVARLRRYAARLNAGAEISGLLAKGFAALLAISGLVVLTTLPFGHKAVVIISAFLLAAGGVLAWSGTLAGKLAEFLGAGVDAGRKTLLQIREELRDALRKLNYPLLVIIDDADRLTPSELLQLFQLIKVNADFPNVVYLLLLDREIAENHIQKALAVNGKDYLDKIVQVAFDVPVLSKGRLQKILFAGLNEVLAESPQSASFDQQRWGNLFLGALQHFFMNLRQVNRFLSTFAFHFSLFRAGQSLEVNPVDLIAIEVLRIFEPKVYKEMSRHKELLTSVSTSMRGREEEQKRSIVAIADEASEPHKEYVRQIIQMLFPPAAWAFGGSRYSPDFASTWQRELRVCSDHFFDRYFYYAIPEGDISQARIDSLLAKSGDRASVREQLQQLADENLLETAIDRLEAYKETIPPDNIRAFITALFDIGDRLNESNPNFFGLSPAMHGSRIVYWSLKTIPDSERRADEVEQAITDTTGLSLVVHFVSIQEQAAAKADPSDRLVPTVRIGRWKEITVEKIKNAAQAGTLIQNQNLLSLLYSWYGWGKPEDARAWCEQQVGSVSGLLSLLRAFTLKSIGHGLGDYVAREHWFIRLSELEKFVPIDKVQNLMVQIFPEKLNAEDKRAVDAFQGALKRREEGKSDFGTPGDFFE